MPGEPSTTTRNWNRSFAAYLPFVLLFLVSWHMDITEREVVNVEA